MEIGVQVIQVIIAIVLLSVWLIRPRMQTRYRGGDAKNLKEEFAVYGLPYWFMIFIGILKVSAGILLIIGLWFPVVTPYTAIGVALLMAGAVSMHIRVKDQIVKSLPALTLLVLSLLVYFLPMINL